MALPEATASPNPTTAASADAMAPSCVLCLGWAHQMRQHGHIPKVDGSKCEVAEDPALIAGIHRLVPSLSKGAIHREVAQKLWTRFMRLVARGPRLAHSG
jgi:hypothetical protein